MQAQEGQQGERRQPLPLPPLPLITSSPPHPPTPSPPQPPNPSPRSEMRTRIQAEYREVVERRVYTVTGKRCWRVAGHQEWEHEMRDRWRCTTPASAPALRLLKRLPCPCLKSSALGCYEGRHHSTKRLSSSAPARGVSSPQPTPCNAGQHVPEEQIDKLIESGEAESIFQKAIKEQVRWVRVRVMVRVKC